MSARILIIDDDRELCTLLAEFLQLEGFATSAIHNGAAAVSHCRSHDYDAIVLDIMLPGMQGLEVLASLRKFTATPVLMLTARGEETDRIVGLEMGADDYLPKPFNPRELVARIRAIQRRAENAGVLQQQESAVGDLQVGDLFDPEENIRGGTRYLRMMLDQFGGDLELALAAYNAGPGAVRRHGGVPPYQETRTYVRRVKKFLQQFR